MMPDNCRKSRLDRHEQFRKVVARVVDFGSHQIAGKFIAFNRTIFGSFETAASSWAKNRAQIAALRDWVQRR